MDDFDRYSPFCAEMHSSIDRAHASFSEELFDLIFIIECFQGVLKNCSFRQIFIVQLLKFQASPKQLGEYDE